MLLSADVKIICFDMVLGAQRQIRQTSGKHVRVMYTPSYPTFV